MKSIFIISNWISALILFVPGITGKDFKPVTISYSFEKGSNVSIDGITNVKDFTCVSVKLFPESKTMSLSEDSGSTIYFKNAGLNLDIRSLNCGNSGMNRDMKHSLKADQYPDISVKLQNAHFAHGSSFIFSGWTDLEINVSIKLAGVERNALIKVEGKQTGINQYHFIGEYPLLMSDFGIEPPTALFGMIKVRNDVEVKFDLIIVTNIINE